MREPTDLIMVTNWEEVEKDDFYLTNQWSKEVGEENIKKARKLQKEGKLYTAYIVPALWLCIYGQTDSDQIFVDESGKEIMRCETSVISTKDWQHIEEYSN